MFRGASETQQQFPADPGAASDRGGDVAPLSSSLGDDLVLSPSSQPAKSGPAFGQQPSLGQQASLGQLHALLDQLVDANSLPDALRDLTRSDLQQLLHSLELTQLILHDPQVIAKLERCGLPVSSLPHVEVAQPPPFEILDARFQQVDCLDAEVLEEMRQFPDSPQRFLDQQPPTIPPSADAELYSREKMDELARRVRRDVGDIDMKVWIVRATLNVGDKTWLDHPLHTITTFRYNGELMVGPFFGSCAGLVLRFCREYPNGFKADVVEKMVAPVISRPDVASTTIAFGVAQRLNMGTGEYELSRRSLSDSAAHNIFSSPRLNFTVFSMPFLRDGRSGASVLNHLYYYRGPSHYLEDQGFVRVLQAIRENRAELRREERAPGGFIEIEQGRDLVRRPYMERLLGLTRRLRPNN
ncbi:MAG: hypothetical protein J0M12_13945 [Deltaproteobacteria bacterium]|nr:hypothetical protein [Deltaproteobacteria bacterium]